MKKFDIDKINASKLSYDELTKLPREVYHALADKRAAEQCAETRSRIDYLPRDWSTSLENKDMFQSGPMGDTISYTAHLFIRPEDEMVAVYGWELGGAKIFEYFRTREKLDSFIEALIQARDEVFDQ